MISNILDVILTILAGLVAGIAGAVVILLGVDLMFRVGDSSLSETLDEIERLREENKMYEDDEDDNWNVGFTPHIFLFFVKLSIRVCFYEGENLW